MTQPTQNTSRNQDINTLADEARKAALKSKLAGFEGLSNDELITKLSNLDQLKIPEDLDRMVEQELTEVSNKCRHYLNNIQPATQLPKEEFLSPEQKEKFKKYEQTLTKAQLEAEAQQDVLGLSTGYKIGDIADLKIPGAAITVLAASTGHGKTTALINFALNIISQETTKGGIYFFSFEEKRHKIFRSFLNIYIDKDISQNNRASIDTYIRDGHTKYISPGQIADFLEREKELFSKFIDNNKINIFHEEPSETMVEDLIKTIKYLRANTSVSLICIDYIQLLNLRDRAKIQSRQEELKKICQLLQECANTTGLPILTAAQFNREVNTPEYMCFRRIGEAGDIERKAELILGIWNYSGSDNEKPEYKMQIRVLKGRGIGSGQSEFFDYNGNTGKFTQGPKEKVATQEANTTNEYVKRR